MVWSKAAMFPVVVGAVIVAGAAALLPTRSFAAGEDAAVTRSFIESLPAPKSALKAGEKQVPAWWATRDAAANTFALRLTRASDDAVTGELFITGHDGGIFGFRGELPRAEQTPVIVMTSTDPKSQPPQPPQPGRPGGQPFPNDPPAVIAGGGLRPLMLVVTPGGKLPRVTAVWSDGTSSELPATTAEKAELLVGPLLEAAAQLEKLRITARELKAIEYPREGIWNPARRSGEEIIVLVRGAKGGGVWGSGTYTADSSLATAAIHAGLLTDGEWGLIRVEFANGLANYVGTERNGVATQSYGNFQMSFVISKVKPDGEARDLGNLRERGNLP
jgi:hypothetical protein